MKKEAQAFLEQYEMDFVKMECKLAERQQWHDLSLSITAQMGSERVQSSGAKDKMASAKTKCIEVESEIDAQVDKLRKRHQDVTCVLDLMEKPIEYKLLHQRYIQFKQLKTIADNFGANYDWVTTTHGRALKSLQKILDERNSDNA